MKKYTLKDGFLSKVRCPVLVSGAAHSLYFNPVYHTMSIFDNLTSLKDDEKQVWMPGAPGDGGLQAKVGAFGVSAERTFQFLDGVFEIKRQSFHSKDT